MPRIPLITLAILSLAACHSPSDSSQQSAAAAQSAPAPASTAPGRWAASAEPHDFSPQITAADFAAHDRKLSSDEFEGRKPGTLGERLTTNYLIEQFKRMGLQPGNHGTWLQSVPVVSTELTNTDVTLDVDEGGGTQNFAYRRDMIVGTLKAQPKVSLTDADIVFVGYGVKAPQYGWNDYAGLDVKGKTVIVLVNDPGFATQNAKLFKGNTMTYYGRWTYKYAEAARQGAAACFIVHDTPAAGYPWAVVQNSWSGPQFDLPASEDPTPRLPVAGWLTTEAAQRLFTKAGKDFATLKASAAQPGFKPVNLDATANLELDSRINSTRSNNVLAMLPGSKRKDEAIIYSAHWDHLGRDTSLKGDQIYNGAIDNGTGLSALLEIAGAFAAQNPRPERSILFAAVTLEESGLLGSKYYVQHPVIPLDKTVADINMDALPVNGPAKNMAVIGFGNSELDNYLRRALAEQHRDITPGSSPEKGFYFRSDHFNFAKAGVPALYAKGGDELIDGGVEAGKAAESDYTSNRYHKPADEFDPNWNLDGVVQDVQALYMVGKQLADETTFPQWAKDSPFRAKRAKMMGKSGE